MSREDLRAPSLLVVTEFVPTRLAPTALITWSWDVLDFGRKLNPGVLSDLHTDTVGDGKLGSANAPTGTPTMSSRPSTV